MLGIAPDNRGLLPEVDVKRLEEFGAEVKRIYGKGLLCTHATVVCTDDHLSTSEPGPTLDWTLMFRDGPVTFDRAVTMEELTNGQGIRKYELRAMVNGKWKTVASGSTIGHKKIDIFPAVTATGVSLVVKASLGPVQIRSFDVFNGAK